MSNTPDFISVNTRLKRERILKTAYNQAPKGKGGNEDNKVVAIRVSGQYLEDLGFRVGSNFKLTINDDRSITLRPWNPEDEEAARKAKEEKVKESA